MKTKFGFPGVLFALFIVAAFVLAPAASQAGTPPNDNGDRLWLRDQDRDQTCQLDVTSLADRLQTRDRDQDRDRDCLNLLSLTPPLEENDGNMIRNRNQERYQHNWYLFPNLAFVLVWPGF